MSSPGLTWDWNMNCPIQISNTAFWTLIPDDSSKYCRTRMKEISTNYRFTDYEVLVLGGVSEGVNFPTVQQKSDQSWVHDEDAQVILVHEKLEATHTIRKEKKEKEEEKQEQGKEEVKDPGTKSKDTKSKEKIALEIEETKDGPIKLKICETQESEVHPALKQTDPHTGKVYLRSDVFHQGVPDLKQGLVNDYPEVPSQHVQNRNVSSACWSHVCGIRCPTFLGYLEPWVTRTREFGFPAEPLLQAVKEGGCLLVPHMTKQYTQHGGSILWTCSFAESERRIISSMTPLAKHVFRIFKVLCFQSLSNPHVLHNEHLRSVYLRLCERVPAVMWQPQMLTQLVMFCVDSLLHTLIERTLPHYILHTRDLFTGISQDFLDQVQALVADIRMTSIRTLIDFTKHFRFDGMPYIERVTWQPVLAVLEDGMVHDNRDECLLKVVVPFIVKLARCQLGEMNKVPCDGELDVFQTLHQMILRTMKNTLQMDVCDALWSFALLEYRDDLFWQVRLQEYIVDHVRLQNPMSFSSNLACMYHLMYCKGYPQFREKAKSRFESCYKSGSWSNANSADYAVFLCKTEDWENALVVLNSIIETESNEASNGYDKLELATLEPKLEEIGQVLGQLDSVHAKSHAFYLLIVTHTMLASETSVIQDLLQRFFNYCNGQAKDVLSAAMLGLSLESQDAYHDAIDAYNNTIARDKAASKNKGGTSNNGGTDNKDDNKLQQWAQQRKDQCTKQMKEKCIPDTSILIINNQEPEEGSLVSMEDLLQAAIAMSLDKTPISSVIEIEAVPVQEENNETKEEEALRSVLAMSAGSAAHDLDEGQSETSTDEMANSEDEDLKKALAMSLNVTAETKLQHKERTGESEEDEQIKKAIAMSLQEL